MKKVVIATLLGLGLLATPAAAGTMPAPSGLAVPAPLSGGVQPVDWRPYYHCHRGRFCHGPRRWHRPHWRRHHYWHRPHWRRHRHWR